MEHQIKHLKETYTNKDVEFKKFQKLNGHIHYNVGAFSIISNYTKKIYLQNNFKSQFYYKLIISNSVKQMFINYKKNYIFIQPINTLKIYGYDFDAIQYDYSFAKYKLKHIMSNVIFCHSISFSKKMLHVKNMFLIEHINKCVYHDAHEFINNKNNKNNNLYIIILKNIKNITIHNEESHMFTIISILKNTYYLFLEFASNNNMQYMLDLNNLCNVFDLNIKYCRKITNTCKIIKNHKLYLYKCDYIFNKFNKNKFIFSFISNLIIHIYFKLPIACFTNVLNGLNTMNSIRILQIIASNI